VYLEKARETQKKIEVWVSQLVARMERLTVPPFPRSNSPWAHMEGLSRFDIAGVRDTYIVCLLDYLLAFLNRCAYWYQILKYCSMIES
jgi:hypothetical protein